MVRTWFYLRYSEGFFWWYHRSEQYPGTWNGSVIDKTYLDDEVLNTSLNSAAGSYLT